VIRLTERFIKSDPLERRDERKLVRHIDEEIAKFLEQVARGGFDRVVGTSGTIISIGAVVSAAEGSPIGTPLRNRRISAKQIRRSRKMLVSLDLDDRMRVPGLEPRRADLVVAGVILLDECCAGSARTTSRSATCRCAKASSSTTSPATGRKSRRPTATPDVRRRSVYELAERCHYLPDTRIRSRGSRWRCSTRPAPFTD
jgi:exopolyphosphatase/guanosine-5'-triphosphate,3'-diphosphate pyrophosphatase